MLSIIFDLLFVVQHFVLYTDHTDEARKAKDVEQVAGVGARDASPLATRGERVALLG